MPLFMTPMMKAPMTAPTMVPTPAGHGGAADEDGSDHVELEAETALGVAVLRRAAKIRPASPASMPMFTKVRKDQSLGADAGKLRRLLVAADGIDAAADRHPVGDEGVDGDKQRHHDEDVREAAERRHQPAHVDERQENRRVLGGEEAERFFHQPLGLLAPSPLDRQEEQQDGEPDACTSDRMFGLPEPRKSGTKPDAISWNVPGKRSDRLAGQQPERQALEDEHAGQRHDEGRDAVIGDPVALRRADRCADARQRMPATTKLMSYCTIMTAASAPTKPMTEPTERSMWPDTITRSMPTAMMTM